MEARHAGGFLELCHTALLAKAAGADGLLIITMGESGRLSLPNGDDQLAQLLSFCEATSTAGEEAAADLAQAVGTRSGKKRKTHKDG